MIQEFLASKLEAEMATKPLFEIAQKSNVKTTSLTRLIRQRKASIKTCEALFEYFGTNMMLFYQSKTTLKVVRERLACDDTLSEKSSDILESIFSNTYRLLQN